MFRSWERRGSDNRRVSSWFNADTPFCQRKCADCCVSFVGKLPLDGRQAFGRRSADRVDKGATFPNGCAGVVLDGMLKLSIQRHVLPIPWSPLIMQYLTLGSISQERRHQPQKINKKCTNLNLIYQRCVQAISWLKEMCRNPASLKKENNNNNK